MTNIDSPSLIAGQPANEYRIIIEYKFKQLFIIKKSRVKVMETSQLQKWVPTRLSRVGAIHKPRKFKIAKMWGLFINRENSNFAKFKTAKLKK